MDGLKVLDLNRPIREADIERRPGTSHLGPGCVLFTQPGPFPDIATCGMEEQPGDTAIGATIEATRHILRPSEPHIFNFFPLWSEARNRGIDTFPLQELALRRECLDQKIDCGADAGGALEIIMRQ